MPKIFVKPQCLTKPMKPINSYHGSNSDALKISKGVKSSRYGFPVLFFATNIQLAKLYGKHIYKGTIQTDRVINWKSKSSYCPEFKHLISNYRLNHGAVLLQNVIDRPGKNHPYKATDLVVVFNFDRIVEFKLLKS